eukprot:3645949-Pleurochrysis_carterae.AAC.1
MRKVAIRAQWERFVEAHALLFEDHATAWRRTLRRLQEFIQERGTGRRPSRTSVDAEERRLGKWVSHQQANYANKTEMMKDVAIREEWARFVETYPMLLKDNRSAWRRMLQKLDMFMKERGGKQRPSRTSKNVEEKVLAQWTNSQQQNLKKHVKIMKDAVIREEWERFLGRYHVLVDHGTVAWRCMLQEVEHFIGNRGAVERKPSRYSKDAYEKRLATW